MGIVGALLVGRWSLDLLRVTGRVLLDYQAPSPVRDRIIRSIENDGSSKVADLHVWSIGPGIFAAEAQIVTWTSCSSADFATVFAADPGIVHTTIEVIGCTKERFQQDIAGSTSAKSCHKAVH